MSQIESWEGQDSPPISQPIKKTNKSKKPLKLEFAIPEEDTKFIPNIRVYNIKIPLNLILNEKAVKKEIRTQRKEAVREMLGEVEKLIDDLVDVDNEEYNNLKAKIKSLKPYE